MDYLIETRNLRKAYRSRKHTVIAIESVNLAIPKGKISIFKGPNGSGKSTLLNLLGLNSWPSGGYIILNKEKIQHFSDIYLSTLRKDNFGFIFQSNYLFPHLTALQNTRLPLLSNDISINEANCQSLKVMKMLEIDNLADYRVGELSGGEMQKVSIARAMVNNPPILIADEPLNNVDSKFVEEFLQFLIEAKENQKTILIASHDERIEKIGDKIYHLENGSIAAIS